MPKSEIIAEQQKWGKIKKKEQLRGKGKGKQTVTTVLKKKKVGFYKIMLQVLS